MHEKIEIIALKQLTCTQPLMAYFSLTSCQHISELNIKHLQTVSILKGLKFPALNVLKGCYAKNVEEKKITELLFEDVLWVILLKILLTSLNKKKSFKNIC